MIELDLLFLATRFTKMNFKLISLPNPFNSRKADQSLNNFGIIFKQMNYFFAESKFQLKRDNKKMRCSRQRFADAERIARFSHLDNFNPHRSH
jgi:hypothetical protein